MIPYGRHDIKQEDIDAVVEVLRSDFLTQGPVVPSFERAVAAYCGARHAVAANSATSALHLACLALGIGPGDTVWTSAITFVASANCALYCGAKVDFVDIDPVTGNMSLECLADKLERAQGRDSLPRLVIPVHFGGQSCDMEGIRRLSERYGFLVLEDASHAIGGHYRGEPVGSCRYSDITVFSFHPVKIITTGEGGMATTNDASLAERMDLFRNHGNTRDAARMQPRDSRELWNYQQVELGYNYRMTDVAAAMGVSQLQRIDGYVARRRAIAARYDQALGDLPVRALGRQLQAASSWHLYVIRLRLSALRRSHREVYDSLHAQGVLVNLHYAPVYRHPYYERLGFKAGHCPQAEQYHREALSLPMHAALTDDQQDTVVTALRRGLDL